MTEQEPQTIIALFHALPEATAALDALQSAGVPYANITMSDHSTAEYPDLPTQLPPDGPLWAIAVRVGEPLHTKAAELLRGHSPLAMGRRFADDRSSVTRGRIAWGHYVFSSDAATHEAGDSAGNTGLTGVVSSGVFSENALAEEKPAAPASPDRPDSAQS